MDESATDVGSVVGVWNITDAVLINTTARKTHFVVRPKGGWFPREEVFFSQFTGVTLGKTILRSETAAIMAVAAYRILIME